MKGKFDVYFLWPLMKSLIFQVVTRVNKCDFTVDGTKISTNLITPILLELVDTTGREAHNCVIPLICYKIYICTFRYVYMYAYMHASRLVLSWLVLSLHGETAVFKFDKYCITNWRR